MAQGTSPSKIQQWISIPMLYRSAIFITKGLTARGIFMSSATTSICHKRNLIKSGTTWIIIVIVNRWKIIDALASIIAYMIAVPLLAIFYLIEPFLFLFWDEK